MKGSFKSQTGVFTFPVKLKNGFNILGKSSKEILNLFFARETLFVSLYIRPEKKTRNISKTQHN